MGSNDIGDDGMSSLVDGLQHNKSLTKLDAWNFGVSVKGSHMVAISSCPCYMLQINTSVIATDCIQRSLGNV